MKEPQGEGLVLVLCKNKDCGALRCISLAPACFCGETAYRIAPAPKPLFPEEKSGQAAIATDAYGDPMPGAFSEFNKG